MEKPIVHHKTGGARWGTFSRGLCLVGSLLILALMCLLDADIIGRLLLARPIAGVPEIATIMIVLIVFLQLPQTVAEGRLTRADLLRDLLQDAAPKAVLWIDVIIQLAGAALCVLIVHATFPAFMRQWSDASFIGTRGVFTAPVWPISAGVCIGAGLAAVEFLRAGLGMALQDRRAKS